MKLRLIALCALLALAPAAQAGGIRTFHSTHGTGRSAAHGGQRCEIPPIRCEHSVAKDASTEPTQVQPVPEKPRVSSGKVQLYRDRAGQWRWRLTARNGKIIATSGGDGYHNRADCEHGIDVARKVLCADIMPCDTVDDSASHN